MALVASSRQEYTGFVQESSGKRNALALAAGQRQPPLADDRLVPVRELLDEIVCPRRSGGGLDLGIGRVRTAEGDVRPHRVAEKRKLSSNTTPICRRRERSVTSRTPWPSTRTDPPFTS